MIFKVIYTGTDKNPLLQDYWTMNEKAKFIYPTSALATKHNAPRHMIDKLVQDLGHAIISDASFLCSKCCQPHLYFHRKDLEKLITAKTLCANCILSDDGSYILGEYQNLKLYIETYFKIYQNNQKKIKYTNPLKLINSLSLLELIFLYNIINELKPKNTGELNLRKFSRFLHDELYNNNIVIQSLIQKKIISHTTDYDINSRLIDFYLICHQYKNKLSNQYIVDICTKVSDSPLIPNPHYALWKHNLIWRPSDCTFEEFSDLLLIKIEGYQPKFDDFEQISIYLNQKRQSEVLFLADAIEYGYKFKIKKSNAFETKSNELCQNYNIKKIYGYFFSAMNLTLIALDFQPDLKRKQIKNQFYSNYIISDKVVHFHEQKIPKNYRYSKNISLLEAKYNLGNLWLEVPVNVFIKLLFEKMNI